MSTFQRDLLQKGAASLGITLDERQLVSFESYHRLLAEWNEKMNLTRVPAEETVSLHFLDSLTICKAVRPTGRILDIGCGAGFPGIPLKIAYPDIELTLVDSVKKKLLFCETVAQSLGLKVKTLGLRAEEIAHQSDHRERYDLVLSRAVADMSELAGWMLPFAKLGGAAVAMKAWESAAEVSLASDAIQSLGGSSARIIELTIPNTEIKRKLVLISKLSPTPKDLPKLGNRKRKGKHVKDTSLRTS
jgi:16S rRNA (guanine527-N7)-methyltransferase